MRVGYYCFCFIGFMSFVIFIGFDWFEPVRVTLLVFWFVFHDFGWLVFRLGFV